MIDVKEAVRIAIQYVSDLFEPEKISNLGLEEVVFDESTKAWDVTVGFSRPWNYFSGLAGAFQPTDARRQYKVVRVNADSGNVISVKIRETCA
jgi:hypothetical protein